MHSFQSTSLQKEFVNVTFKTQTQTHTQPPENSEEEAKGIHVAFLLSSKHNVSTHPHPVPAIFLNPFCKGQKSSTNLIVSLPNVPFKNIQPPSKSNKEGLVFP